MKITVFVEGKEDVAILRALLPPELLDDCEFRGTEGRSTIVSVARTHIIKHHVPTAIILDTDSLDATVIVETVQTTNHLLRSVAGGTPFKVLYCIPHIEAVFFDDSVDLRRIFPKFEDVFILQFAKTQPKQQLQVLFEKGGGPRNLSKFLDHLTLEEARQIQSKPPIRELINFIRNNRQARLCT